MNTSTSLPQIRCRTGMLSLTQLFCACRTGVLLFRCGAAAMVIELQPWNSTTNAGIHLEPTADQPCMDEGSQKCGNVDRNVVFCDPM
jgi:hypothetical protein